MPDHVLTAVGIVVGTVLVAAVAAALRTGRVARAGECAGTALAAVGCVVLLRVHLERETSPWRRFLTPDPLTVVLSLAAVGLLLVALLRFRATLGNAPEGVCSSERT